MRFWAVACKFGAPPRPLFFTCPYFVVYTRRKRKGGAGAYFKGQGLSVVMMREFSPRTFRTSSVPHGTWRGLHTAHGNLQSVCSGDPVLRAGLISRQLGTVGRPGSAGSLSVRGTDHVYRTLHACVYRVGRFRSQPVDLHRSSGRAHGFSACGHTVCAIGRWMCGPRRRSNEGLCHQYQAPDTRIMTVASRKKSVAANGIL